MIQQGDTIDARFVLEQRLGRGGMGEVWRARQMPLGRTVALKLLREEYSTLGHLRRRFAREARAAARLNHEHIAAVFDFGQDAHGGMYIAMEHVEGLHLGEASAQGLSVRQIVEVAFRLLDALAHAHARGVVHRDLKPENILLQGSLLPELLGSPKIVDFGIATLRDDRHDVRETLQDQVVGTPLYMSPEQASGDRELSPRTDLYSLGLILYELLSGAHPFDGDDSLKVMHAQVSSPLPRLIASAGLEVPEELERVVLKALEKSPLKRWESAAKMRAAIEPLRLLTASDPIFARAPEPRSGTRRERYPSTEVMDAPPGLKADAKLTVIERPAPRIAPDRPRASSLDASPARALDASALASLRLPMVGREEERERLLAASRGVEAFDHGRVVMIEGEAGLGKTRLAMWLKETLEERGAFHGHIGVFMRGAGNARLGLQEIFESVLRTRGLAREEVRERVRLIHAEWGASISQEDVSSLTDFLSPRRDPKPQGASRRTTSGGVFSLAMPTAQLYACLVRALQHAAESEPRLLLLDDLQWAGVEVFDFLDFLLVEMRLRPMRVLVIATARSEELRTTSWQRLKLGQFERYGDGPWEAIALERMDAPQALKLLDALLPIERDVGAVLAKRSAGNPLHLILLARHLVQQGHLARAPGSRGRLKAQSLKAIKDAVPPSLAELFRLRLETLETRRESGERLKRLLSRGAVLGKRFSYDALYEMCLLEGNEPALATIEEDFDALLDEGLITEVVGRGEEWYTFSHGMMRDVLLEEVLGPARRRALHRLAAEALIALHGEQAAAHAASIASHWYAARRLDEAIEWLWRASQGARRAYRQRDALAGYQVCAQWMEQRLKHDPRRDEEQDLIFAAERFYRARVSRSRYLRALVYGGDLHEGLGDFEAAETLYRRVVRMCGKPAMETPLEVLVPLCQAWLGMGHVAWQRGDFVAAHWAFTRVWEVLSRGDVALDIANAALRGLARVAWHRGEYQEAAELAERAYALAEERGEQEARAESLWILGEVARMVAMKQGAAEYFERSMALYKALGMPTGLARNLLSQAQLARYHRDAEAAESLYRRALESYTSVGDRRGQGMSFNGLGEIARFQGDHAAASAHYARALRLFEGIGAQYDVALTSTNLGLLELRRGDLEAAERYLQAALDLTAERDYPYLVAGLGYNLALVKMMRGEGEQAEAILGPVWAINDRVPISDLDFAEPLEQLGALRAEQGSGREAAALWRRARAIYEELGLQGDLERVDELMRSLG